MNNVELDGDVTPRILSRQEMTPQVNKDNEELEIFDHFTINVHFELACLTSKALRT